MSELAESVRTANIVNDEDKERGKSFLEYDVALEVKIVEPEAVCSAVRDLFLDAFPNQNSEFQIIEQAFVDVAAVYRGEYPGYHASDTDYHDLRHIMDVTLAMMRLLHGYQREHQNSDLALGMERVQIGVIGAIFHDVGYIRHRKDTRHKHGAEYTKVHVSRGADFLASYLPAQGKQDWVPRIRKIIHYTGYEKSVAKLNIKDPLDHSLGCLLGTADLIAQMADRHYLERCRDCLYEEFKIGNVPAPAADTGEPFESPLALLYQTPDFIRNTVANRLDAMFGSMYRYAASQFDGENLYMQGIEKNCEFLEQLLAEKDLDRLQRKSQ